MNIADDQLDQDMHLFSERFQMSLRFSSFCIGLGFPSDGVTMTVQTVWMDCMIVLRCPAEMLSMLSSSLGLCLALRGHVQLVFNGSQPRCLSRIVQAPDQM